MAAREEKPFLTHIYDSRLGVGEREGGKEGESAPH